MNILYTSDTHVHPGHLDRALKAARELRPQLLIVGGDIIPDWKGSIAASIEPHKLWVKNVLLPRLGQFRAACRETRVLIDFGNDDIAAARPLMEEADGIDFDLLHTQVIEVAEDLVVAGYMVVNPTPFLIKDYEKPDTKDRDGLSETGVVRTGYVTHTGTATPHVLDRATGTMVEDLSGLSAIMENPQWGNCSFIFVCHAPPKDTALDRIQSDLNVGSLAVRRFIEHWSPSGRLILSLHGHIHEAPWKSGRAWQHVGDVPCFNVGQTPKMLRALLVNTESVADSARLVTVSRDGEVTVAAKGEWL
jgi:uncharacterized protein